MLLWDSAGGPAHASRGDDQVSGRATDSPPATPCAGQVKEAPGWSLLHFEDRTRIPGGSPECEDYQSSSRPLRSAGCGASARSTHGQEPDHPYVPRYRTNPSDIPRGSLYPKNGRAELGTVGGFGPVRSGRRHHATLVRMDDGNGWHPSGHQHPVVIPGSSPISTVQRRQ